MYAKTMGPDDGNESQRSYVVNYDVTRSGMNYVWASLATAGGLQAPYYISPSSADYLSDDVMYGATAEIRVVETANTVDLFVASVAQILHGMAGSGGALLNTTSAAR